MSDIELGSRDVAVLDASSRLAGTKRRAVARSRHRQRQSKARLVLEADSNSIAADFLE